MVQQPQTAADLFSDEPQTAADLFQDAPSGTPLPAPVTTGIDSFNSGLAGGTASLLEGLDFLTGWMDPNPGPTKIGKAARALRGLQGKVKQHDPTTGTGVVGRGAQMVGEAVPMLGSLAAGGEVGLGVKSIAALGGAEVGLGSGVPAYYEALGRTGDRWQAWQALFAQGGLAASAGVATAGQGAGAVAGRLGRWFAKADEVLGGDLSRQLLKGALTQAGAGYAHRAGSGAIDKYLLANPNEARELSQILREPIPAAGLDLAVGTLLTGVGLAAERVVAGQKPDLAEGLKGYAQRVDAENAQVQAGGQEVVQGMQERAATPQLAERNPLLMPEHPQGQPTDAETIGRFIDQRIKQLLLPQSTTMNLPERAGSQPQAAMTAELRAQEGIPPEVPPSYAKQVAVEKPSLVRPTGEPQRPPEVPPQYARQQAGAAPEEPATVPAQPPVVPEKLTGVDVPQVEAAAPQPKQGKQSIYQRFRATADDYLRPVEEAFGLAGARKDTLGDVEVVSAERLRRSKTQDRLARELDPVKERLGKRLAAAGVTSEEMGLFLQSRGAALRRANVAEINPELVANSDVAGAGMSQEQAAENMQRFKADQRYPQMVQLARLYDEINAGTRKIWLESGDKSPADIAAMEKAYGPERAMQLGLADPNEQYQSYFTHYRTAPTAESPAGLGQGAGLSGSPTKRALGRTTEADNPLMFALMDRQNAIIRAEKIRVQQRIAGEVKRINDPNFAKVVPLPTKPQLNSSTGLVENLPDPTWINRPEVLPFKEGGATHAIVFNKDLSYVPQILKGETVSDPVKYVGAMSRLYGRGWTRSNPLFPIKNVTRDVPRTLFFSYAKHGMKFAADVAKAWPRSLRDANRALVGHAEVPADVHEFMSSGAPVATYGYSDYEQTAKSLQKAIDSGDKKMWMSGVNKFVEHVNDAFENATRLAAYRTARAHGQTIEEAAITSKQKVNLNFERHGNIGPALNSLWTFSNANIQDTAAIAGLLKDAKSSKRVAGGLAGLVALGAAIDAASRMMSSEDKDGNNLYDKGVSESQKHHALTLQIGPYSAKLPMQQGLNFFLDIGRHISEVAWGARTPTEAAWLTTANLADVASPLGGGPVEQVITPTAGDLIVQLGTNKNYSGGNIVPEQRGVPGSTPTTPGSQLNWRETPEPYKWLARTLAKLTQKGDSGRGAVEVPPDLIRWFISNLGGYGRLLDQGISGIGNAVGGKPIEPRDIPLASDFAGKASDRYVEQDFTKNAQQVLDDYTRWRQLKDAKEEMRATDWLVAHPNLLKHEAQRRAIISDLGGGTDEQKHGLKARFNQMVKEGPPK